MERRVRCLASDVLSGTPLQPAPFHYSTWNLHRGSLTAENRVIVPGQPGAALPLRAGQGPVNPALGSERGGRANRLRAARGLERPAQPHAGAQAAAPQVCPSRAAVRRPLRGGEEAVRGKGGGGLAAWGDPRPQRLRFSRRARCEAPRVGARERGHEEGREDPAGGRTWVREGPGRPRGRAGAAGVRESCCRHAAGCQIALVLRSPGGVGVSLIPARIPSPRGGEPGPGRPGEEGSPGPAWVAEVGVGAPWPLRACSQQREGRAGGPGRLWVRSAGSCRHLPSLRWIPSWQRASRFAELACFLGVPGGETGVKFLPCIWSRPVWTSFFFFFCLLWKPNLNLSYLLSVELSGQMCSRRLSVGCCGSVARTGPGSPDPCFCH